MKGCYRRTLLSSIGAGIFLGAGVCSTAATASEDVVEGQVVDYNGDPIANRQLTFGSKDAGHFNVVTDREGRFAHEVTPNSTYRIGFYKYKYGPQNTEPNGVPHVCSLGRHTVKSGKTDLGKISVKEAHLVEVQALDSDGNPLGGVGADLYAEGKEGDYWGTGPSTLSTNHEGFIVVDDAQYTGMELVGTIDFSISIPNGNGSATEYSRKFFVDEPLAITVQVGEGMTITSADAPPSETPEPTTEKSTTEEPTTEESMESTENPATKSQTTAEPSTETPTTTFGYPSTTTTVSRNETAKNVTKQQRGFFTNDSAGEEFDMLSDPFTLTVAGFVLSAGGIAHSLIRGR